MEILFVFIIVVYICIAIYFALLNDLRTIKFLMISILFQNIISISFCRYVSGQLITIFQLVKEAVLYLSVISHIVRSEKIVLKIKEICWAIVYIAILIVGIFRTPATLYSSVIALRYLFLPIICVGVGRSIRLKIGDLNRLYKFLISVAVFLAITGIIEILLLRDSFWVNIGYSEYAVRVKGSMTWSLFRGVTRNFYTWDFFGIPLRRIVSITADPLANAFLVFIGALLAFTGCIKSNSKGRINKYFIYTAILTIISIMTLSKAIFIFVAITLFFGSYYKRMFSKSTMKLLLVVLIAFVIIVGFNMSDNLAGTSSGNHINGFISSITQASVLGNGLGTAGVTVEMVTNANSSVTESYIGSVLSQIGILGLCHFMMFWYWLYKKIIVRTRKKCSNLYDMALIILVGLLVCMTFSESSVSLMGTGIYFIILGIASRDDIFIEIENSNRKKELTTRQEA